MTPPRTFTYTWTQTRLETIQDQVRFLCLYGSVAEAKAEKIIEAVGKKVIAAVAIYGRNAAGRRVAEVELRVDWKLHEKLTLTNAIIVSGLPGWTDKETPEIRVAGKRFATLVREANLEARYWVRFIPSVLANQPLHDKWKKQLNLGGAIPAWEGTSREQSNPLLDLAEANIYLRRAVKVEQPLRKRNWDIPPPGSSG
jgi:hypothetical protein